MHTPQRWTTGFAHLEHIRWRYKNGCSISRLAQDYRMSEAEVARICEGQLRVGYFEETARNATKAKAAARLRGRAAADTQSKDRSDECSQRKRNKPPARPRD